MRVSKLKDGLKLTLKTPSGWDDIELGESIATNGVCLTVSGIRKNEYDTFLMPETLSKSSFGRKVPEQVNLERALSAGDRFGGHFVQGHVDCAGVITEVNKSNGYTLNIKFPTKYGALVVDKGSIAIDGVSLTVVTSKSNSLSVALIPHTLEHTTLHALQKGDVVNLEFDMIGRYIVKVLEKMNYAASRAD